MHKKFKKTVNRPDDSRIAIDTLESRWKISVTAILFLLVAILATSHAEAAVKAPMSARSTAEISLRASGMYSEIFELAMDAYRDRNVEAAIRLWSPIAESGYAAAQYNVGVAHARGLIGSRNMRVAQKWWQAAAQQGNVDAQYNLGLLYATGNGVDIDMKKAVHWWQQAATVGDPASQYNLGMMYARGEGVAQNMDAAYHWWTQSAAQKFPQAEKVLNDLAIRK
jgi:TPR repeat protein